MEWWQVYLWTRVEAVHIVLLFIATASAVGYLFLKIFQIINEDLEDEGSASLLGKYARKCFVVMLIFTPFALACPSRNDFALIYVLPKIANSTVMQKDVPEVYDLAVKQLKGMLGEK